MGYAISIFKSSQLPQANEIRTKNVIILAIYLPIWTFFSFWNMVFCVRANNLFWRVAIAAPKNPIHRVRCWTNIWDAGILRIPISLVNVSKKGRMAITIKILTAKLSSIFFNIFLDKKNLRTNLSNHALLGQFYYLIIDF